VKGDDVGAGLGEVGNDPVDGLDHQVHVDRRGCQRADGGTDKGADGQVGDVMVVHDIEVNPVGAGGEDVDHLIAKPGEIGGKNTRRYDVHEQETR